MSSESIITPRKPMQIGIGLVVLLVLFGFDFWSKQWAVERLSRVQVPPPSHICEPAPYGDVYHARVRAEDISVIDDLLEFSYAENCGAAFGFLNDSQHIAKKVLFLGAALGVSAVLLWMFIKGQGGRCFASAVPLVVAGAMGNFVDRSLHGYVVDFIRFYYQSWSYPTFNLADVWIAVGTALLLIDGLYESRREKKLKLNSKDHAADAV